MTTTIIPKAQYHRVLLPLLVLPLLLLLLLLLLVLLPLPLCFLVALSVCLSVCLSVSLSHHFVYLALNNPAKASAGISTFPILRILFLPSFCFCNSFFFLETSPP